MKAFITGGSGFVGCHVLRKLVANGYEVIALGKTELSVSRMETFGAKGFLGDIRNKESMRAGMQGADVVFHLAAENRIGADNVTQLEANNIIGTRNVLELAYELKIPKIVYTSSVAVFGDTEGKIVDEDYRFQGSLLSQHDRTKWVAHYEIAEKLIEQGAPIVIVMPGQVFGPGDRSILADLMRRFYRGHFSIFPAAETGLALVHVEDVALGHLLAAQKGQPGESYILAGPALTMRELTTMWAAASGTSPPRFFFPTSLVLLAGPILSLLKKIIRLPKLYSEDVTGLAGATFYASSDKAAEKLGWRRRSLDEGFRETFLWIKQTTGYSALNTPEGQLAGALLSAALIFMVSWLIGRIRQRDR